MFCIAIFFLDQKEFGKKLFAEAFAKRTPDYFEIEPDGNSIKINQMRDMQKTILEKPIVSERKVYVINNAELMTREAQNSLLKTLEEPPSFVCIILISSNDNMLLDTIKSRCIKISFNKLTDDELKSIINISGNLLKMADGSVSKAIELEKKEELFEKIQNVFGNLENMNMIDFLHSKEEVFGEKEDIQNILEYINLIFFEKLDSKYGKCIELVENTKKRLGENSNFDMTIDRLLLKTWEIINE